MPVVASPDQNAIGIITTGVTNRVEIYASQTNNKIADANGNEIYGRITEAGGVYTISYFSLQNGTELGVTMAAGTAIDFEFNYRFDFARLPADFSIALTSRNVSQDPRSQTGSGSAGIAPVTEALQLTGQNVLSALSQTPLSAASVSLIVNGVTYYSLNATIFGINADGTINWNESGVGFGLAASDRIIANYLRRA
jgi:hypothetical protein